MPTDPTTIASLTSLLSPERLSALTKLTKSAEKAIELHQETLRLGAALMNVIATIEISLRNSVCENLGQHFSVPNWLMQPPVPFQWKPMEQGNITKALDSAKRAEYSKLSQAEKSALDTLAYPNGRPSNISHLKRAKDRRRQITVTKGKVIAELTFYFWKRLFSPEYEQTLWRTSLKKIFPNKHISRATVATELEQIYQSRNRLAHHEPVIYNRFNDTMRAINFVAQNLGMTNPSATSPLVTLLANDIHDVIAKANALHAHLDSFRKTP